MEVYAVGKNGHRLLSVPSGCLREKSSWGRRLHAIGKGRRVKEKISQEENREISKVTKRKVIETNQGQ